MAQADLTNRTFSKLAMFAILGCVVAFSSQSFAQDTTPPAVQAPAAQVPSPGPAPQPPANSNGQTQQPAAPAQTPSPTVPDVTSVKFDDWYYRCVDVKDADGKVVPSCEVAQISQVKQNGQDVNVLTLAIARTAPDPAVKGKEQKSQPASRSELLLTALVPLNVFLPAEFAVAADGKSVARINYRNCNQAGCWAQQKLDVEMLGLLQKGNEGTSSLRLLNGQNINIKFSLKGLSAALSELQKPAAK